MKFINFKDKEFVRQCAPAALSGTPFGIKEQFPSETESRRKLLCSAAKYARQNPDNKVRLIRDRLFINGKESMPDKEGDEPKSNENRAGVQKNGMNNNRDTDRTELNRVVTNQLRQRNETFRSEPPYRMRQNQHRTWPLVASTKKTNKSNTKTATTGTNTRKTSRRQLQTWRETNDMV